MDPQAQFCPNESCSARGVRGDGNIGVHSQKEERYICHRCGKTFAATTGTPFYRRRYEAMFISQMISLLSHGCPAQAIVATYEVDERTVYSWQAAAGDHCEQVHQATIQQGQLDLEQVQVDELRVRTQIGIVWMALAIAVSSRLWLGGVVNRSRDMSLAMAIAGQVKACALCRPLLICFDGFVAYIRAFRQCFRSPLAEKKVGRPRLIPWPNLALGQVVKQYSQHKLIAVKRRLIQGDDSLVQRLIQSSQAGGVLNTAFIERLNATFRACLTCLTRRSRALARTTETLTSGMYLVGSIYNFCSWHDSLHLPLYIGRAGRRRWVPRTPAMAAGLTDHRWSVLELLSFKVPPLPFVPPKRRGRPPKLAAVSLAT